jgi:hypothetical protein
VTATLKPVPKGQTKGEATVAVAAGAAAGPNVVVLRATTKVGGKDYVVTPLPIMLEVIDAETGDAKKEEPKKEEPKKKGKK